MPWEMRPSGSFYTDRVCEVLAESAFNAAQRISRYNRYIAESRIYEHKLLWDRYKAQEEQLIVKRAEQLTSRLQEQYSVNLSN